MQPGQREFLDSFGFYLYFWFNFISFVQFTANFSNSFPSWPLSPLSPPPLTGGGIVYNCSVVLDRGEEGAGAKGNPKPAPEEVMG